MSCPSGFERTNSEPEIQPGFSLLMKSSAGIRPARPSAFPLATSGLGRGWQRRSDDQWQQLAPSLPPEFSFSLPFDICIFSFFILCMCVCVKRLEQFFWICAIQIHFIIIIIITTWLISSRLFDYFNLFCSLRLSPTCIWIAAKFSKPRPIGPLVRPTDSWGESHSFLGLIFK